MKKKMLSLLLVVALAATAVIGGTLAYFTDTTGPVKNVVTLGEVNIDLEETYDPTDILMPGIEIEKKVDVKNVGTVDAYARVVAAFQHSEKNDAANKGGLAAKLIVDHSSDSAYEWFTTEVDHIKLADGKWYSVTTFVIDKKLAPNEAVATLEYVGMDAGVTYEDLINWGICTKVENEEGADEYTLETFDVLVAAQAVQVDNIGEGVVNTDTTGDGAATNIDEILDKAFGDVSTYTADQLNTLFGIEAPATNG